MGPDGHTASLFPGSDALGIDDPDMLVVANRDPQANNPHARITLTLPASPGPDWWSSPWPGRPNATLSPGWWPATTCRPAGSPPARCVWLVDADAAGDTALPDRPRPVVDTRRASGKVSPMPADRGSTALDRRRSRAPGPGLALLTAELPALQAQARQVRDAAHGNRITFSPKVFIPLTMLCRDRCGYCTFAKAPARVESPYLSIDEVLAIARAGRAGRLPRGALHPRRGARGPVPGGPAMAGRPRLRLHRRLPGGRLPGGARGDRPAPPRQRRRPRRRATWPGSGRSPPARG